jgi:holo-[acyl-carrier protein] synthase
MAFKEIEVVTGQHGKPDIVLHGRAEQLAQEMGFEHIALSLSHTNTYAVAFVAVD